MFKSPELEQFLLTAHTIQNGQAIFAEWNLNQLDNIERFGNYRYRPATQDPKFGIINPIYDPEDVGEYYTGATDSNIAVDFGINDNNVTLETFVAPKKKMNLLYSLEDCFKQHRPRSGINKLIYLGVNGASYGYNQYFDSVLTRKTMEDPLTTVNVARRPRYYMSSRMDDFKYWTSFRQDVVDSNNVEYGISITSDGLSYIYDAAPFVVYKNQIPTNKICIKMQTNVGDEDLGPFRIGNTTNIPDPLYGYNNQTTPERWAIQVLDENNRWFTAISFDENSVRQNGDPVIGTDGTVEIEYGIQIPQGFEDTFLLVKEVFNTNELPFSAPIGYAYLLKENPNDKGILYVSDGASYQVSNAVYGWTLSQLDITRSTNAIHKLTNPEYFIENDKKVYREIEFIRGIRIVVDTMNKANCTFDLIEMSPRLFANITEKTTALSVQKVMSDLGNNSMPTGNLLASTGKLSLFDEDFAFNANNPFDAETSTGSIISSIVDTRVKFSIFEIVKNVDNYDYYIPLKTLYSEGFPEVSNMAIEINMNLRDLFFLLESKKAPEMLLTNVSMSYAITVLLDSIGFSNYVFKRTSKDEDLMIPFFFVDPKMNVAEILSQLAAASQSAMFFDEYNNLVVMYKNYILPTQEERETDLVLYGQEQVLEDSIALPNIANLSSQSKKVYNDGTINYTTRYIQKSIGSIIQAPYVDEYKTYVYKPVLLWEVAGQEATKTVNELGSSSSAYSLSAMPLKTTLTADTPVVVDGQLINNILDFGESVYWAGNFQGYFYSNGEIIRYDAIEYSVAGLGNVWITNNQKYQEYFSKLKFNGKMYPTGRIRIYAEVVDDVVKEHGRGQFGTTIVQHNAGIDDTSWVNDNYVRGCIQSTSQYLFNTNTTILYPSTTGIDKAGDKIVSGTTQYVAQDYAKKSTRNGIIKNFMANTNLTENDVNYFKSARSGTVQSSALIFNGPQLPDDINPSDFISYSYKEMDKPYNSFGTRLRVIGKIESDSAQAQTANGASGLYSASQLSSTDPSKQVSISGGGGGLAVGLNKDTNMGYYFEIQALNQNNVSSYKNNTNIVSYEISKSPQVVVENDEVTVYTAKRHDFLVAETVSVSGLIDDNNKINNPPTTLNGVFSITDISSDRKAFKFKIDNNSQRSAKITAASRTSNVATYSAKNSFSIGQTVTVSGMTPPSFNQTGIVTSSNNSSFTLSNTGIDEAATAFGLASLVVKVVNTIPSNDAKYINYVVDKNPFNAGQGITVTGVSSGFDCTNSKIVSIASNTLTKSISSVSSDGTYVTYTTSQNHGFFPDQLVTISGISPDQYNAISAVIYDTPTSDTFRVANTTTGSATLSGATAIVTEHTITIAKDTTGTPVDVTGTMQYIPLTTESSSGGTASRTLDSDTVISDIFFYKVVSADNSAQILNKERTGNIATLTTLREHSFRVGERVSITNVDAELNGSYIITAITPKTFSYTTSGSGTISSQEVTPLGDAIAENKIAVPQVLWRGLVGILVDDGKFTSQARLNVNEKTTVYDLAVEYANVGSTRRFYLYLNDKQVATVDDESPLPQYNNMALFVRGSSRCMFENVYALTDNLAENSAKNLQLPISKIFGDDAITKSEALRKYAINGVIQSTYLSGISSESTPKFDIFYDEFGTIMREAAYFNIKYDRSYPALYAAMAPALNRVPGYTVSGFFAGSYGAEFLIFNASDKTINLDDTTGNYLRILGISFTQNTSYSLTVDDFFNKNSSFSDSYSYGDTSSQDYRALWAEIKNSRSKFGTVDFVVESAYIQTNDAAESTMEWIIKKVMYPRKSVGVAAFAVPHLQLGDIVTINYQGNGDIDIVSDPSIRYVVYNIEYSIQNGTLDTTVHLAEV